MINKKIDSRITAAKMRFLRRVQGVTRRDRIRNQNIRNQLHTTPIVQNIENKSLRWLGHVTRMSENRLPKRVMEARPTGSRGKGRPRVEWTEHVNNISRRKGKSLEEAKKIARDRAKFKEWILTPEMVQRNR